MPGPVRSAFGADSRLCAGCHRTIWETYRNTGMGRSFYKPSPEKMVEDFAKKPSYYHPPSDSYFEMVRRGEEYFQRRYQRDSAGRQINMVEKRVDYVMGSGNHARAYLHRTTANTLVQLTLGWYSEKGGYWAMNPGYDRPNHDGFRRPITYDCMFCHNSYPDVPEGHDRPFASAVYRGPLPEGIDCERCHGSGARHIQEAGRKGAKPDEIRAAIVNPRRMTADRQTEICMACHLETTSFPLPNAMVRYDRGVFSFRPGEPLGAYILNFDHAPGAGRDDKFELVNAAYRMRKSNCFLKSGGRMTCTTCHDPHNVPRGREAVKHYDAACRSCHSAQFDRKIAAGEHTSAADCAACHMPKRRTEDVVHAAATDHLIQRLKPAGDLLAERPERHESDATAYRGPVILFYPEKLPMSPENELYLAVAQVKQGSNLKGGIPQLTALIDRYSPARAEWYFELAEALLNDGHAEQAARYYRSAVERNPSFAVAWRKLGTALRGSSRAAESADALKRATSLASEDASAWHEAGLTYRALGRAAEAAGAIERSIERDPELADAHNNLGILRLSAGRPADAEASFREAIRINPDYADAHGNLANILAAAGKVDEARDHFETSLKVRPKDAPTRYNYAMLLGRASHYDAAQRELEESLRADSDFADAHEVLGDLLMAKGDAREAAAQYREAVRLRPDSARNQLRLGSALAAAGDRESAVRHLRRAAEDPVTRDRANEVLSALGFGR